MPKERDVFSDQSFAIQLTLSRSGPGSATVDQVLIGHRPAGLYGAGDKSHLVPWLAFCDGLRADVVGQSLQQAISRVAELYDWTLELPSADLSGALRSASMAELRKRAKVTTTTSDQMEVEEADKAAGAEEDEEIDDDVMTAVRTPSVWHSLAAEHAIKVIGDAMTYIKQRAYRGEDVELQLLQNAMSAYLHRRNTMPLTAIAMPNPIGPPSAAATTVRNREAALFAAPGTALNATEVKDLTAALWGLLDVAAMTYLAGNTESLLDGSVLGVDPKMLPAYVAADHLLTMEQTYPHCCAKTDLRNTIGTRLGGSVLAKATELLTEMPPPPINKGGRVRWPGTVSGAGGTHGATGDMFERFAVQLDTDGAGKVTRMYVGARPKSPAGRHSTAWVALCDYVRNVVTGIPVTDVFNALARERLAINRIGTRLGGQGDLLTARTGNTPGLALAQLKVAEFLTDLNAMPGAIEDTGGTSGGSGESRLRKAILTDGGDLSHLLGMLDPKVLSYRFDKDPAATGELALRVALHLYIVRRGYPAPAEKADLFSENTVAGLLFPVNVAPGVANEVGKMVMAAVRPDVAWDPEAYRRAADRHSSEAARSAKADPRRAAKEPYDETTEYRPSQDSQGSSQGSSQGGGDSDSQ